jgi:hypothetical protein
MRRAHSGYSSYGFWVFGNCPFGTGLDVAESAAVWVSLGRGVGGRRQGVPDGCGCGSVIE